jgi:cardiolipin synthase
LGYFAIASDDFRVAGPVVRHLASAFADDWELTTGEKLGGPRWFPPLPPAGDLPARVIPSGPDRDLGLLRDVLLGALRVARERVDLLSPYFIPDEGILAALGTASRSGVHIRVLLPRRTDHPFMAWAARAYLWDLVRQGVEIQEVAPGGFVLITVPALMSLWSAHDVANEHHRRYTKETLRTVLQSAGLQIRSLRYFFFWPLAPLYLRRLLRTRRS